MNHPTVKFIFCFFMILSSFYGFSQLGYTEKQIIEVQGKYFKKEVNEKSFLLHYNRNLIDDYGKSSPEVVLYIIDKKTNKCFLEVYNCSKNVINTYYKTLNSMAVQIYENTWKNYNNNSIYVLKVDGNILNIQHSYTPINSSNIPTNINSTILSLQTELNKCKNENQGLITTIEALKDQNAYFFKNTKDMTILTQKGAENIEKALASIKEKDLKILRMQDALMKKDSLMLVYITELKMKSNKK